VREKGSLGQQSLSWPVIWVETKAGGSCGLCHGHDCGSSGRAWWREGEVRGVVSGGSWRSWFTHLLVESTGAAFVVEIDGGL